MLAARPWPVALAAPSRPAWLDGWLAAERGRFAPWLAVWMGAGGLGYFAVRTEPAGYVGGCAVLVTAVCLAALRHASLLRALPLCALAAAIGFSAAQLSTGRALPIEALPTRAVVITGTVRGVELLPEGRRITLDDVRPGADAPPLARAIRVRLRPADRTSFEAGDVLRLRALLRPPPPPAYPGAWDLQRDAFFAGLGGSGQALGPADLVVHATPSGPARWWQGVRDRVARRVMQDIEGPAGAIAATLLTGSTASIPADDRAAFRDSGLAHLLAVAGLHMGLVMGLVMGVVRLGLASWERAALGWPIKAIAAGAALAAGFGYMMLVGAHVPVVRSFAMAALVTLAILSGRRALSLRGLALAAAAILLITPSAVNGVSFQMSFSAVAALIAGYEIARPYLARLRGEGGWRRWLLVHVTMLALTSLLAGSASAPFAAYHFGHVQVYSILANVVAVPITAMIVMPCGLLVLLLMPFGLDHVAAAPMGWGIEAVLWIARATSALPSATVALPHVPVWALGVISVGLAWACLWRTRLRLLGIAPVVAGLLAGWWVPAPDILVSADARLIEIGGFVQAKPGATPFVRDAWATYLARASLPALPEGVGQGIDCTPQSCRIDRQGSTALLVRAEGSRPDCAGVSVVVAAEPLRGACPASVPSVDRFSVWRDGAHAIWLTESGAEIVSDRAYRGERPWVAPAPAPARARSSLPQAESETLPAE